MALLRVALVPLVAIGQTSVDHPGRPTATCSRRCLLLVGVWAVALLGAHALAAAGRVPPLHRLARVEPVVDLMALGALTYTSGGPYSEARLAFFALPLVAAFRLRPALTAAWTRGGDRRLRPDLAPAPGDAHGRGRRRDRRARALPGVGRGGRRRAVGPAGRARPAAPRRSPTSAAGWSPRRSPPRIASASGSRRCCTTRRSRTCCWRATSCATIIAATTRTPIAAPTRRWR